MKGHVLLDGHGYRWIFVPEANIHFRVTQSGKKHWIVCAFRTDGYHGLNPEDAVPVVEYLKREFQWTKELDIPEHLVQFAVESERLRQESVENIQDIMFKARYDEGVAYEEFMRQAATEDLDQDFSEEVETKIALEIRELLVKAGGLQ